MIKKQLFITLFSLILMVPLWGMDPSKALQPLNRSIITPKSPEKSIRFTSNFNDNYPYLINKAYQDENLQNYAMEKYVLSQDKSIESMNAAVNRGANVYLTVGSHAQNPMDKYQTTTTKRDPNIHGKVLVGVDTSPSKQTPKTGILLFGSANATNSAWQHKPGKAGQRFNFESGMKIEGDMDIITPAYKMIKNQSPMKPEAQKTTLLNTPTKISIYGSKDTNLNKSLARRFDNAAQNQGTVKLRTMTLTNKDVVNSLSKLGPNAEVIVDYSALTAPSIPLLQQLHDSKVSVNIFKPQLGSRAKQHGKDIVIESEGKKTYISSTANITEQGDTQRNYQLYVPNNEQVIADAKEDFEKVKKETITLPEALKRKNEEIKQKATTKKTSLKKQKLIKQ